MLFTIVLAAAPMPADAGLLSPEIGWQASLTFDTHHHVSGTVTIVDEDSLRVDDFTYDGGGHPVYFYLGTEETEEAFKVGQQIGPLLNGTIFDGTQDPLLLDLPVGQTLEGFHSISVWCVRHSSNFGSGTFGPVPVPEPAAWALLVLGCWGLRPKRTKKRHPQDQKS